MRDTTKLEAEAAALRAALLHVRSWITAPDAPILAVLDPALKSDAGAALLSRLAAYERATEKALAEIDHEAARQEARSKSSHWDEAGKVSADYVATYLRMVAEDVRRVVRESAHD